MIVTEFCRITSLYAGGKLEVRCATEAVPVILGLKLPFSDGCCSVEPVEFINGGFLIKYCASKCRSLKLHTFCHVDCKIQGGKRRTGAGGT